jgi:hypothetical protein
MHHTPDSTLSQALYQLSHDIESPDGVANAAIFEAGSRLEYYVQPMKDHEKREIINRVHHKLRERLPDAPAWLRTAISGALMSEFERLRVVHALQEPKP